MQETVIASKFERKEKKKKYLEVRILRNLSLSHIQEKHNNETIMKQDPLPLPNYRKFLTCIVSP